MDASPFLSGYTILVREELPDFLAESVEQARTGIVGPRASTILEGFATQYFAFFLEGSIWCVERGYRTRNQLRHYRADGQLQSVWPLPDEAQKSTPAWQMAPGTVFWSGGKSGESALMIYLDGKVTWQRPGRVPEWSDQAAWRRFWPTGLPGYQPGQELGLLTTLDSDQENGTGGFKAPTFAGRRLGRKDSAALALDMSTAKGLVAYWPPAGPMPTARGQWDFARAGRQTIRLEWTQVGKEPSLGSLTSEGEPLKVFCRQLWHETHEARPQEIPGFNPLRTPVGWPLLWLKARGEDWVGSYVQGSERHHIAYHPGTRSLDWDMHTGPAGLWEPVRPHDQWSRLGPPAPISAEHGKAVDWGEVSLQGHPGLRVVWAQCLPPRVLLSIWIGPRPLPIEEVQEESRRSEHGRDDHTDSRRADLRWVSDGGSWGKWTPGLPETRRNGCLAWRAEFDRRSGGGHGGVQMWSELELEINPGLATARWTIKYVVDVS